MMLIPPQLQTSTRPGFISTNTQTRTTLTWPVIKITRVTLNARVPRTHRQSFRSVRFGEKPRNLSF